MNWKKIFAIVRREYVERVRTKAFWIATLLIPILFLGFLAIQISISRKTGGVRNIVVVDLTGNMEKPLAAELAAIEAKQTKEAEGRKGPHWSLEPRPVTGSVDATKDALRREVLSKRMNGYLVLDPKQLGRRSRVLLVDRLGLHRPGSAAGRDPQRLDAPEDPGPRPPGGPRERSRAPHEHEGLQGDREGNR